MERIFDIAANKDEKKGSKQTAVRSDAIMKDEQAKNSMSLKRNGSLDFSDDED